MEFCKLERQMRGVLPLDNPLECPPDGTVYSAMVRSVRALLAQRLGDRRTLSVKMLASLIPIIREQYGAMIVALRHARGGSREEDAERIHQEQLQLEDVIARHIVTLSSVRGSQAPASGDRLP